MNDEIARMRPVDKDTNPVMGTVRWSPLKSIWFSTNALAALLVAPLFITWGALAVSFVFTVCTLCLGHTVGLHRLLIHRSFKCPQWVEYTLVTLGTIVGMGGPFRMIYLHEIRDWAQRHPACHPFYIHQGGIFTDFIWQLNCELELENPPRFTIENPVARNRFYRFLQRTWLLQQALPAILLLVIGGLPWLLWGVCVRVTISLAGHWAIGYFAHNVGQRTWHLNGHAIQGYNLPHLGLLTMGECWHNNHHAFPGSARLGIAPGQSDPGWWAIRLLAKAGLAHTPNTPETLPPRPERTLL